MLGSRQHPWTEIDSDNGGVLGIEWEILTSTDARIQQPTRKSAKEQWPQRMVASALKWQIEQIVEWRDPFISIEIRMRQTGSPPPTGAARPLDVEIAGEAGVFLNVIEAQLGTPAHQGLNQG